MSYAAEPDAQHAGAGQVSRIKFAPIIDLRGPAFAGDGDTFLGQVRREIGAIVERGDIAVGEFHFEAAAVLSIAIAGQTMSRGDGAAGKETE